MRLYDKKNLVEIAEKLKNAKVNDKIEDITAIFTGTESKLIKDSLAENGKIKVIKLTGFAGLIGMEIQPTRRLGTEFSDYAIAFGRVTGIIHSDELPKFGITSEEVKKINQAIKISEKDAFVLVASDDTSADVALKAVMQRAQQAIQGVPPEVRKANPDGSTKFLRPMPGSARMYPETDATIISPNSRGIKIPKLLTEKASEYEKLNISSGLAHTLIKEGSEQFFEIMVEEFSNINPSFIGETLVSYAKEIEGRDLDYSKINDTHLKAIFSALNDGQLAKESVMDALAGVASGKSLDLEKYRTMSDAELNKALGKIVRESKQLPMGALIGKAMGKLRGKASGQKIVQILKKIKNQKDT